MYTNADQLTPSKILEARELLTKYMSHIFASVRNETKTAKE